MTLRKQAILKLWMMELPQTSGMLLITTINDRNQQSVFAGKAVVDGSSVDTC